MTPIALVGARGSFHEDWTEATVPASRAAIVRALRDGFNYRVSEGDTNPARRALRGALAKATGFGFDVFCTCDRRMIIRKREQLRQLPLRILTPAEWWAHVKPWAGLRC